MNKLSKFTSEKHKMEVASVKSTLYFYLTLSTLGKSALTTRLISGLLNLTARVYYFCQFRLHLISLKAGSPPFLSCGKLHKTIAKRIASGFNNVLVCIL